MSLIGLLSLIVRIRDGSPLTGSEPGSGPVSGSGSDGGEGQTTDMRLPPIPVLLSLGTNNAATCAVVSGINYVCFTDTDTDTGASS
jgi:hypothetical protein